MRFRKATASGGNDSCVEVARADDGGAVVRHSKDPDGPRIAFNPSEWQAFLDGVRKGEFDLGVLD